MKPRKIDPNGPDVPTVWSEELSCEPGPTFRQKLVARFMAAEFAAGRRTGREVDMCEDLEPQLVEFARDDARAALRRADALIYVLNEEPQ